MWNVVQLKFFGSLLKLMCWKRNTIYALPVHATGSLIEFRAEVPVNPHKKAGREFRGNIDYRKLRVAAGQLVMPSVRAEVDAESRKECFASPRVQPESIDCFLDDKIYGVVVGIRARRYRVMKLGTREEAIGISVDFPENAGADEIIIYVFAASADGKDVSDAKEFAVSPAADGLSGDSVTSINHFSIFRVFTLKLTPILNTLRRSAPKGRA